jgi:L-ribulokinase
MNEDRPDGVEQTCVIGLDFGSNSVRALVVRVGDGYEVADSVFAYPSGEAGVLLDPQDPHLARQHPSDYVLGLERSVLDALETAKREQWFERTLVAAIGVDTTGSTPIPLGADARPLAERYGDNLNALAWMWKDHTATAEAQAITRLAHEREPQLVSNIGGSYSSEWYWSKVWHCAKVDPALHSEINDWVELADYIPALLVGRTEAPPRDVCAAGHKMLYRPGTGFPPDDFLTALCPDLLRFKQQLERCELKYAGESIGALSSEWQQKFGLGAHVQVSAGAFDAHLGAVGSGVKPGTLVKIVGTSTCDIMVHPKDDLLPDIPGVAGQVDGSVMPGFYGIEAGQSAVGDLLAWWAETVVRTPHAALTEAAAKLQPGQSGLLALDWNNGNRTVLVNQELSGLIVGQTLHTKPAEIYRALIEATAFGARKILERLEEYGVPVLEVVACGGIAEKNMLMMQIYADVLGKDVHVSGSSQTPALGSAIAAATASGHYSSMRNAERHMVPEHRTTYHPRPDHHATYMRLYRLYSDLHDQFGDVSSGPLGHVMRELKVVQAEVRADARKRTA